MHTIMSNGRLHVARYPNFPIQRLYIGLDALWAWENEPRNHAHKYP